jgi:hypothetical protein
MVGILDAAPNVPLDHAAVAVAIFRVGTVLFAALLGGAVYLFAWRGSKEQACPPERKRAGELTSG